MTVKTQAVVIGKTKKAIQEKDNGGKTSYSLQVVARERYYDRDAKKASYEPITVFVNLYGKMSDKMKEIMSNEGTAVVITGELEKSVARDSDGKPMTYNNDGPRKGDFMYDVRLRGTTGDLQLAPRSNDNQENSGGSDKSNDTVGAGSSGGDDEMYV